MESMRSRENLFMIMKRGGFFVIIIITVILLQGALKTEIVFGAELITGVDGLQQGNGIYFENDRVEAGVALKVAGAPEGSVYQWVLTGADSKSDTFTTTDPSYTPAEDDIEKLITVTIEGTQASASIYFSTLPVIYINNADGYYGVNEDFTDASMSIQGNAAFSDQNNLYQGDIEIKQRGNSTRNRDKRPFNIKLDKKTDLLGMGENKHWALLANDIDHTLMRNKLLYDFSGAIGMQTYMKSESVVLIFNNEYYGVYQLSEIVNLGSERVDIYDWEESAEDASKQIVKELVQKGDLTEENADQAESDLEDAMCMNLSWITSPYTFSYDVNNDDILETYHISDYVEIPDATGGALLEMDFYAFDGRNPSTMITSYSQPLYFKSPEYAITNETLFNYINKYIQSFEYALHSTDFIYHQESTKYIASNRMGGNEKSSYSENNDFEASEYDGKHYSELFDMDSLVQNFIVCEYSMNWDSMKNSVFMYKDIDGLFRMGPEWDFDWAWGNINMYDINTWYPESWHTTERDFTREQYYQTVQWNRSLIRDPYFLVRVYEKYNEIRGTVIEDMIKDGGTIDTYTDELTGPAAANDARWSYSYSDYNSVGFKDSVENMNNFINTRVKWLDEQFSSLDTLISSLNYYKPDDEIQISDVKSEKGGAEVTVQVSNADIASIAFQVNGTNLYTAEVKSGKAVCEIPDSALVADEDVYNVVQAMALDKDGTYIIDLSERGNYAMAKSNYAVFYNNADITNGDMSQETFHGQKVVSDRNRFHITIAVTTVLVLLGAGIIIIIRARKKKSND